MSAKTTAAVGAPLSAQCAITREIAVAEGVFAPGRLGELKQIVPFEMVDAVLAESGAVQERLRKLPARVVVYLLLAATLFEDCGYLAVWRKLTGALRGLPIPKITATGLWHARCRLGARPMRALFDLLRGHAGTIRTAGTRWAGLLVVAIDGTCLDVPDNPATRARLGKRSNQYTAASGYPQIFLVTLVACGTRAIIDAVFGPGSTGEAQYAQRLARSLHPGMIVLRAGGEGAVVRDESQAADPAFGQDYLVTALVVPGDLRDGFDRVSLTDAQGAPVPCMNVSPSIAMIGSGGLVLLMTMPRNLSSVSAAVAPSCSFSRMATCLSKSNLQRMTPASHCQEFRLAPAVR